MNDRFISQTYFSLQNNARNKQQFFRDWNYEARYESLVEAITYKDKGTVLWLINEGCSVNNIETHKNFDTPLHIAVYVNDVDIVKILISAGAQINIANSQNKTPLHLAFEMDNKQMMDLLLPQCDGKRNPFTVYGLSHFHIACIRNNLRVILSFLDHGTNANAYPEKYLYNNNYVFYRPLHLAVKFESFEATDLLLKHGANVNVKDKYRRTPLHLACRFNYKRICELIKNTNIETSEEVIDLIRTKNNQVDIVKLLLQYRSDINALDSNDTPPLFHIFKCDYQMVKNAINEKIKLKNEDFWSRIIKVFKTIQQQKFYTLIQQDANIKFCNKSKETLLHLIIDGTKIFTNHYTILAAKKKDLDDEIKAEILDLLLNYGADIEAKNANGYTPLQMAISSFYVKTVKTLLNHHAIVNNISFFKFKIPKRNIGGNYNLFNMENFLDIISLILKRKSDLNISRKNELLILLHISIEWNVKHFENCSIENLRNFLDFGDINCMDILFYISENWIFSNREKMFLISEHIQKLEIAGMYINKAIKAEFMKYNGIIDTKNNEYNKIFIDQCSNEIQKLKEIIIDRYASFYDLLFFNINKIAIRMKNRDFRRSIRMHCNVNLILYNNLIIKQFIKGLIRSILLEVVKQYLTFIFKLELPDPCSENIFGYLKNKDLCNFALAFEK